MTQDCIEIRPVLIPGKMTRRQPRLSRIRSDESLLFLATRLELLSQAQIHYQSMVGASPHTCGRKDVFSEPTEILRSLHVHASL